MSVHCGLNGEPVLQELLKFECVSTLFSSLVTTFGIEIREIKRDIEPYMLTFKVDRALLNCYTTAISFQLLLELVIYYIICYILLNQLLLIPY